VQIEDRFDLSAPAERVWQVMNDVELIAPYVPGFALREAEGDVFRGTMKVKLGAMTVEYDTEIAITERDDTARTVRMNVVGRELRGGGNMQATVTSRVEPAGTRTAVTLDTDLELVGKVAQMGRGMIADVSSRLVRDFVHSLEANVLQAPTAGGGAQSDSPAARSHAPPSGDNAPVDLTGAAARAAATRMVPVAIAAAVALWLLLRLTRYVIRT
jgi:carbon monoxide dehydrogenase subunit G